MGSRGPMVIIGNGGAGIAAVKALRSAGFSGEICMLSDTKGPAFNPMLAPYFLKGAIAWDRCFPLAKDFYNTYQVNCCFGHPVRHMDTASQVIFLADNSVVPYGKCLIATGANPVIPPVPGLADSSKAFALRTAAHTRALGQEMASAKTVVIMGASLVGLKLAEILSKRKVRVVLVDIAPQMFAQGAHPETAALLEAYFKQHGVDTRLGCGIDHLEDTAKGIVCSICEEAVAADFVAVCTGIRPNMDFLSQSPLVADQAICVDERMQTRIQGIYAAGDVCQGNHLLSGETQWLGTWGNACLQGRTAGLNMAGADKKYLGNIPQHISPIFDWNYAQMGQVNFKTNDVEIISRGNPFKGPYYLLAFQNHILAGANLINCTHNAGIIRGLILRQESFRSRDKQLFFQRLLG